MTIDAYLAELRRRLPRTARLRALPETREHLRDAAARHHAAGVSPAEAEAAATAEFGAVEDVVRRFGRELAVRETRLAGVLAVAASALFVFPLYVVPENTLPPAQWAEKPRDILVLQVAVVGCWLLAVALAAAGAALAWTRASRFAAPLLAAATTAILASVLVSVALVVRWFAEVPATPSWPFLAAPLALACLAVGAGTAAWTRERRPLLG